jgi:type II secretory pathway pseudopilin PulG
MNAERHQTLDFGLWTLDFGPRPKVKGPRSTLAFTLVELLVAATVLVILMGMVGMIYKTSSSAVNRANATTDIYQKADVLQNHLTEAANGIVRDSYLVIYGWDPADPAGANKAVQEQGPGGKTLYNVTSARADVICFFVTGAFNSLTTNLQANSGFLYFGHAGSVKPPEYGTSPFDTTLTGPLIANRWVLCRFMHLFTPGNDGLASLDDNRDATISQWASQMSLGVAFAPSYQYVRDTFFPGLIQPTAPAIDFSPTPPTKEFTFPYFLPNCGSFKIEFAMPASFTPPGTGSISQPERDANGIVWRDALDPNRANQPPLPATTGFGNNAGQINGGPIGAAAGSRGSDQIVIFRPTDTWPLMLRFTVRLYDRDVRVSSPDAETGGKEHGGLTFKFVVPMPE